MRSAAASPDRLTVAGRFAFVFLWLFVMSFPSEKGITIPGLGTISRLFGLIALGTGMMAVLIDCRVRIPARAHALLAAFVLWSVLSYRWSVDPVETVTRANTDLQLLGMAWLIWEFCPTEERILSLMRAYVLGTFYPVIETFSRFLSARQTYYLRYSMEGFDPNDLALTLALSLPLSYSLALRSRGWRAWIYWVQIGLVVMAILLSASRMGFMVVCLAAVIVPFTFRYLAPRQRLAMVGSAALALAAALAVVPATSWARLSTIGSEVSSGTMNNRILIWNAGLQAFRARPFQGVGAGAFPRSVEWLLGSPTHWVIVAHNTFLSVLVETGVIGFTLFFIFLTMLVAAVWYMGGLNRITWAVMLLVWGVGVSSLTWEYQKPTWLVFALVIAASRFGRPPAAGHAPVRPWRNLIPHRMEEVVLP